MTSATEITNIDGTITTNIQTTDNDGNVSNTTFTKNIDGTIQISLSEPEPEPEPELKKPNTSPMESPLENENALDY